VAVRVIVQPFPKDGPLYESSIYGIVIRSPFRVVGATGEGSLFLCMTIEHEPVDCCERRELCIGQGIGALSVCDAWQRLSAPVVRSSH
jgi:hypothetical protein